MNNRFILFFGVGDSDSDSDSDNDERDRKIHVEIKPLNNGSAPISASVDELRATVENLSLSPLGGALSVCLLIESISNIIYFFFKLITKHTDDFFLFSNEKSTFSFNLTLIFITNLDLDL